MKSSQNAIELIHRFEGWDIASQWPGEKSGITIPYGYDLGYEQNFESDWKPFLQAATIERLKPAIGMRGQSARHLAPSMRGIQIPKEGAESVFENRVLPRTEAAVEKVFPGSGTLPGDAFGALVSLIFNRGELIDHSDRRREMLQLRQLFLKGQPYDLRKIADLVESQKRLWPHRGDSDGDLWTRRIEEAKLIRSAA